MKNLFLNFRWVSIPKLFTIFIIDIGSKTEAILSKFGSDVKLGKQEKAHMGQLPFRGTSAKQKNGQTGTSWSSALTDVNAAPVLTPLSA